MDSIRARALGVFTYPNAARDATRFVGFTIDGKDLRALVQPIELPYATAEGHPEIAGAYGGLLAHDILPPSEHLLGKPTLGGMGAGTALLGCECGEWGCWPLMALVTVTVDAVQWSDFRQPHRIGDRHWSYEDFGPFSFVRSEYVAALLSPVPLPNDPWIGRRA